MKLGISLAYENFVSKMTDKLRGYSTPIGWIGAVSFGIIGGNWGYEAGGIGGGIVFTVFGILCGGGLGVLLPDAVFKVFGTFNNFVILTISLALCVLLKLLFNFLSFGLLLFILAFLFLIYL